MAIRDIQGRPYARLGALVPGAVVIVDGDFTCMAAWSKRIVCTDGTDLFIPCKSGHHTLDGQLDFEDDDILIGIYHEKDFTR